MTNRPCRWGILGTANIAKKNWAAIRRAGNAELTAVGSRSIERSQQFIAECQVDVSFPTVPQACGSYEELLARKDIDAVYIPLPTGVRKDWVIRAAEAGKHVLVEKPVGVTAQDVKEIIAACEKHRVQFMDGVMFMHSQRLERLRSSLDDGITVGKIRRIASQFSFNGPQEFRDRNIRVSSELEPLGCLGDLGWYNIRFTLWVQKYRLPQRVTGRMLAETGRPDSPHNVPLEFSAELLFADGVSASLYCSFQTQNQQWANVSGEKGYIQIPDFVVPYYANEVAFYATSAVFNPIGCGFHMEDHTVRHAVAEYSDGHPTAQETNLFRNFSSLVISGRVDPEWGEIALKTQIVLDACLESARSDGRLVALP